MCIFQNLKLTVFNKKNGTFFTWTRSDKLGSSSLAINFFSCSGFFSYTLVIKMIKTVIVMNSMISIGIIITITTSSDITTFCSWTGCTGLCVPFSYQSCSPTVGTDQSNDDDAGGCNDDDVNEDEI